MKVEIEAKCRVDDLDEIERRLIEADAEPVACMLEQNVFFDSADREMAAGDCGLRVRTLEFEGDRNSQAVVTFKGPRQGGRFKARQEIEFTVDQAEPMIALLGELGYHETIRFEKRRGRWRLGGCTVELDEMPYLGKFVEVEGVSDEAIIAVREKLGLSQCPTVKSSYVSLLWSYLMQEGIDERAITFDQMPTA